MYNKSNYADLVPNDYLFNEKFAWELTNFDTKFYNKPLEINKIK